MTTQPPPPPLDPTPYGRPIAIGTPLSAPPAPDRIAPWNASAVTETARLEVPGGPSEAWMAFTPDGRRMVSHVNHQEMIVRSLPDGAVVHRLSGAVSSSWGPDRISPDGRLIALGNQSGEVSNGGSVDLWDLEAGDRARQHRGGEQVLSIAFAEDGRRLVAARVYGRSNVWRVDTGELLADVRFEGTDGYSYGEVRPGHQDVAWLPYGGGAVLIGDALTGALKQRLALPASGSSYQTRLSWRPDGSSLLVLVGQGDQVDLQRYDGPTLAQHRRHGLAGRASVAAWSPADGAVAVAGFTGGPTGYRHWALDWAPGRDPQPVPLAPDCAVDGLSWSADGRLLAIGQRCSDDGADATRQLATALVEVATGRTIRDLAGVSRPQFAPGGAVLVAHSGGPNDPVVHLFGVPPGGHTGPRLYVPAASR